MSEAQKVIDIALNEVGYKEKASNKDLNSKTSNAGKNNYTKYARDLDALGNFYNGKKNGYDWCDVFVDWCFVQAFGKQRAMQLLNQPEKSTGAGCGFSMNFYKSKGQLYSRPQKGDQIFFTDGSSICHTGLVYDVDNSKVYTVEGNTRAGSTGNYNEVCKKSYPLNANYIAGYGRPKYSASEKKEEVKQQTTTSNNKTVLEWQKIMNKTYSCAIEEDNKYENYSKKCANKYYLYLRTPMIYNNHVKFIQKRLIEKGFSCGKYADNGYFGGDTRSAVIAFQKANGLTVDGFVGAETTELLLK